MKSRRICFESLEDRCLLAVTAGGMEPGAAFAEAAPQATADDQMNFALVITDTLPVDAEVADPTVSVGDGVNLISETGFGNTVYVSLYVKSTDPAYGVQYGYCSLRYDEAGLTPDTYYAGPNFNSVTINDGFDFCSVGCISAFGGEPSNPSASFGKTGWALVGTMSFSADVVGQYEFTTGTAVNAKGEERESWGFVREDFDDTYEYSTPAVSASLAITGEMPVIEDVTVEGWTGGYDESAHSVTVTDPSADTDKILYSTDGANYNLDVCPEYFNEGTYTTYVRVSRTGYANWYGSATVEIQHVTPVVTTLEDVVDSRDGVTSLREAIGWAVEGDVITFDESLAGGTITLNGTQLEISAGITIDASDIGGITIDANRESRAFYATGGTNENPIGFVGLTITGGYTTRSGGGICINDGSALILGCNIIDNKANERGGGVYKENGSLTTRDSTFTENFSSLDGGGIYNNNGSLTVSDAVFSGNSSLYYGGGICNFEGTLTLTGSTFLENSGIGGGGICNFEGTLTLTDSTLSKNSNVGIYNHKGSLTLINSTLSENTAGSGGGIYNNGGVVTITTSIFVYNTASDEGGAIYNYNYDDYHVDHGTITITESVFTHNIAHQKGGGISNTYFSVMSITDSIFSDNFAPFGGGISNDFYGTLTLSNSVILENTASRRGGGIFTSWITLLTNCTVSRNSADQSGAGICYYASGEALSIINSIVALNTPGEDIYYEGDSSITACNSLSSFTDWTESSNCLVFDPSLPLFEDAENGDYTLAQYSQAVNKGDNSYVETETDLAGNQRIVNEIVDLGAYERQELAPAVILTGTKSYYVSYGANRHRLDWEAVPDALAYELAYSTDGLNWTRIKTEETFAIVTGLTYGDEISYRVRALGEGVFIDSDWSEVKTFAVCPMDINNDRAIAGADRRLMSVSWLAEEGEESYQYYADINGDGDVSNADRSYLSNNWLKDVDEDGLNYPKPLAADMVFAEFTSADLGADLAVF